MKFELTEALIDEILFFMEDQEGDFMLDTVEGVVAGGLDGPDFFDEDLDDEDGEGGERYISLPEWDSSDGFRLMERFAASFRNPMVREELSSALSQGRGVFRAFKNVLGRHPEVEKLWYSFKEKEMKREVIRWYNGLLEEWGLEQIGIEPEDTDDLVTEDFSFRPLRRDDIFLVESLHRQCLKEFGENIAEAGPSDMGLSEPGPLIETIINEANVFSGCSGSSSGIVAESSGGEFAGYISGVLNDSTLYIQSLEVKDEFRGLGVGETMLARFLDSFDPNEVNNAFLDLPSWAEGFSRVLLRESFKPYTVRYWLNFKMRNEE